MCFPRCDNPRINTPCLKDYNDVKIVKMTEKIIKMVTFDCILSYGWRRKVRLWLWWCYDIDMMKIWWGYDDDMTIMMSGDVISDYDLSGAVFTDRPLFHPQCSCPAQWDGRTWYFSLFLHLCTIFLDIKFYTWNYLKNKRNAP